MAMGDHPPPYVEEAPPQLQPPATPKLTEAPPAYDAHTTTEPDPESTPKTSSFLKRHKKWVLMFFIVLVTTIGIVVAKVRPGHARDDDTSNRNSDAGTPSKIVGLAAAECLEGTFVIYKTDKHDFYLAGTLNVGTVNNGSSNTSSLIPATILFGMAPVNWQVEEVDLAAVCYNFPGDNPAVEVHFFFQNEYTRIVENVVRIHYTSYANTTVAFTSQLFPSVSQRDIEGTGYRSSIAATYIRNGTYSGIHLFYLLPITSDASIDGARVIQRVGYGAMWGGPSSISLNVTAKNVRSRLAVASFNSNSTPSEIHVFYMNEDDNLATSIWRQEHAFDFSSGQTILYTDTNTTVRDISPFTVCIPYISPTQLYLFYLSSTNQPQLIYLDTLINKTAATKGYGFYGANDSFLPSNNVPEPGLIAATGRPDEIELVKGLDARIQLFYVVNDTLRETSGYKYEKEVVRNATWSTLGSWEEEIIL